MSPKALAFFLICCLCIGIGTFFFLREDDKTQILSISDTVEPTASPTRVPSEVFLSPTDTIVVSNNSHLVPVVKVVDGDTIQVNNNGSKETVRLIGINTPESVDPRKPVECFGKEAADKAKELLTGRSVTLVSDPTQDDLDKYHRLLRYVYRDDGLFINQWMIENGYAYEYTYDIPYRYQTEFKKSQQTASENNRGLWNPSACNGKSARATSSEGFVDKDCSDFATQSDAQAFFLSQGGPARDPDRLDPDKDGKACESLP